jgi:hypothetical protein
MKLPASEIRSHALDLKLPAGEIRCQVLYNLALSNLDEMKNNLDARARKVKDMDSRWLSAIRAKSGPDSDDYEKAGGTRRSDRNKPGPKGSKSSPKT